MNKTFKTIIFTVIITLIIEIIIISILWYYFYNNYKKFSKANSWISDKQIIKNIDDLNIWNIELKYVNNERNNIKYFKRK